MKNNKQKMIRQHRIVIITSEMIQPFHLSVPNLVFGQANKSLGWDYYEILHCAEQPSIIQTGAGYSILINHGLELLDSADTIIIPSWHDPLHSPSTEYLTELQAAHLKNIRIIGLCLGAFVMAYAGILNGKEATTHWAWINSFNQIFPSINVDANALYVNSQNLVTSAGTAAAIDCCLDIVRKDHGAEVANQTARYLVVAPHREGGQAQYIEQPVARYQRNDHFSESLQWMIEHLNQPHCLETAAERAHMSVRNYSRQFKRQIGCTLKQWLVSQRLQYAQQLLESQKASIESIAEQVGFGHVSTFRQQFIKAFAITPKQYRNNFYR